MPRETPLAKTLFAVDELSGFIAACALVRPTGIEGMTPKSVRKKLKQPSFAAGVDRDQIRRGTEELGVDENQHVQLRDRGDGRAGRRARPDGVTRRVGVRRGVKIDRAAGVPSRVASAPAPPGLGPLEEVIDGAEIVGNTGLPPVPDEQHMPLAQL